MDILQYELKKMGLKEKEAKVYLVGLELGPASIKQLAEAAGITRPTAYEIVSALEKRGLFAESKQDKRKSFVAQSPEVLLGILHTEQRALAEREREFLRIISALENKFALSPAGGMRLYHGEGGMSALEEKIVTASSKHVRVLNDHGTKQEGWLKEIQKRMGKLSVQEFSAKQKQYPTKSGIGHAWKKSPLPDSPTLFIFSDRVVILNDQKKEGYLIENPLIVDLITSFFDVIWA